MRLSHTGRQHVTVHGKSIPLHSKTTAFPTANKHVHAWPSVKVNERHLLAYLKSIFIIPSSTPTSIASVSWSVRSRLFTHSSFNLSVTMLILILLNIIFLCLQFNLPAVYAKCCLADVGGDCGDNSAGTPCCGYNKCNGFCCACPGGKPISILPGRLFH